MKFFVQVVYTQNPKRTKFEAKVGTFSGKINWSKHIKTDVVYFFSYHPLFLVAVNCVKVVKDLSLKATRLKGQAYIIQHNDKHGGEKLICMIFNMHIFLFIPFS